MATKGKPSSPSPGAGSGPVVLIDSREQTPLDVGQFLPIITAGLYAGDYSALGFEDEFAIERKSIPDLLQSLTASRERFEHELIRLRGYRFRRLLIVGKPGDVVLRNHRKITPQSIFGSLGAYEARFDCPVVWEPCPTKAARIVARWAYYFHRESARHWQKVQTCTIQHAAAPSVLQAFDEVSNSPAERLQAVTHSL